MLSHDRSKQRSTLPPEVPSCIHSRKRKRASSAPSAPATSEDGSQLSIASTSFTPSVKSKVVSANGAQNRCWHCDASPTRICHVVGKRLKHYIAKLKSQGLLSIDHLGSFENAVALCGTCRDNFINLYEPAFIFLPSDLQFFLRWEKEDFRFRINDYRNFGTCRARRPPTAADYNKWLSQKLQHDSETELSQNGGLYSLYTLHEYLPRMPGISATRVGLSPFHKSKRWHGDPMASLRRAFLSLGSRAHVYPRLVRRQLQRLQDMYIENTEQRIKRRAQGTDKITDRSSDSGPDLEAVQNLTHIQPEAKKLEHETPGEQSKNLGCPVKSQAPEKNVSRALSKRKRTSPDSKEASAKRRKPGMEPQQKPHWTWGPEATSNRAMELFRKRYMARKAKREKKAKEKAVEYKAESRRPEGLVTPRSLPKPEKSDFGRT